LTNQVEVLLIVMVALDVEAIFAAALNIQLNIEKSISVTFSTSGISIKFPTTRRLAEFLDVPHYYVLPYFAMMEQEALVTRAERVGIMTTTKGTKKLIGLMAQYYRPESEALLGPVIFQEIVRRVQDTA
jgi:DNA-binding transcriptional regulator YhcF (GntR family)